MRNGVQTASYPLQSRQELTNWRAPSKTRGKTNCKKKKYKNTPPTGEQKPHKIGWKNNPNKTMAPRDKDQPEP